MHQYIFPRTIEVTNATEKTKLENKVHDLEYRKTKLERQVAELEGELTASQKEVVGLKCSVAEMSSASAGLRAELETVQRLLKEETSDNSRLRGEISVANSEIQDLQVYIFLEIVSLYLYDTYFCLCVGSFAPRRNSKAAVTQPSSRTKRKYQSFLSRPCTYLFRQNWLWKNSAFNCSSR